MILVTGATGNVGSAVVRALAERGAPVRAFVRDVERARSMLGAEVELARGDFAEPASIAAALDGVEAVFLSSADGPDKVRAEIAVVDAAAAARVARLVKASTIGAEAGSALPTFDWHGRIEEYLGQSRLPAVVLHSCFYMTNLLAAAESVAAEGRLYAPAGEARIAMIDPRDVAAVAAAVLTTDGHEGLVYELTGPEATSYADVAAELARVLGRPVEYVDVPDEAARRSFAAAGMPPWLAEQLGRLFPLIRTGVLAAPTDTVHRLTGRSPRSFAEFARDHAALFAGSVAVPAS